MRYRHSIRALVALVMMVSLIAPLTAGGAAPFSLKTSVARAGTGPATHLRAQQTRIELFNSATQPDKVRHPSAYTPDDFWYESVQVFLDGPVEGSTAPATLRLVYRPTVIGQSGRTGQDIWAPIHAGVARLAVPEDLDVDYPNIQVWWRDNTSPDSERLYLDASHGWVDALEIVLNKLISMAFPPYGMLLDVLQFKDSINCLQTLYGDKPLITDGTALLDPVRYDTVAAAWPTSYHESIGAIEVIIPVWATPPEVQARLGSLPLSLHTVFDVLWSTEDALGRGTSVEVSNELVVDGIGGTRQPAPLPVAVVPSPADSNRVFLDTEQAWSGGAMASGEGQQLLGGLVELSVRVTEPPALSTAQASSAIEVTLTVTDDQFHIGDGAVLIGVPETLTPAKGADIDLRLARGDFYDGTTGYLYIGPQGDCGMSDLIISSIFSILGGATKKISLAKGVVTGADWAYTGLKVGAVLDSDEPPPFLAQTELAMDNTHDVHGVAWDYAPGTVNETMRTISVIIPFQENRSDVVNAISSNSMAIHLLPTIYDHDAFNCGLVGCPQEMDLVVAHIRDDMPGEPDSPAQGEIAIGQTVEGTFTGSEDETWLFSAEADQTISLVLSSDGFDALDLFGPDGTRVIAADYEYLMAGIMLRNIVLPLSGQYRLVAYRSQQAGPSPYTLTLTPEAHPLAGTIGYGQTVQGSLDGMGDYQWWTFEGTAGDVVTIFMDSGFDNTLALSSPDGSWGAYDDDSGGGGRALISDATLPVTGTYTITPGVYRFSDGGPYSLTLTRAGGGDAVPAQGGRQLAYDQPVSTELASTAGDRWTFAGTAGDLVSIDLSSDAFDAYLELYDPNGTLLTTDDDSGGNYNARILTTLPASGTYEILARALFESTGTYTLVVSRASVAGTISYGQRAEFNLLPGAVDLWQFEGTAGDRVSITLISAAFDSYLELRGPDGAYVAADDDSGFESNALIQTGLPLSGTYLIMARAFSPDGTGSYLLELQGEAGQPSGGALPFNTPTQGWISSSDGDEWTFEGTAGTLIQIDMVSDSIDSYLDLRGPDGTLLISNDDGGGNLNARITYSLPTSSTYTVVAQSLGGSLGPYTITLGTTTLSGTIGYGQSIDGRLQAGNADKWAFEGTANDQVTIELRSDAFDAYLELFGPDGRSIATDDDSGGDLNARIQLSLPGSGRYMIFASALGGDSAGPYQLALQGAAGEPSGGALQMEVEVQAWLTSSGGDRWTFDGTAGSAIVIDMLSDEFDAYLELLAPDGRSLGTNDDGGIGVNARLRYTLPQSGTYTVVASSFGGGTGPYRLAVRPYSPAGTLRYNQPQTGSLAPGITYDWTFAGTAGDLVSIDLSSDAFDAYLELFGPDGATLANDDDSGGNLNARIITLLPTTGTYIVAAQALSADASGAYQLRLGTYARTGSVTYGQRLSERIEVGAVDAWSLDASAGDSITIRMTSDEFDSFLGLYGPDGALVAENDDGGGDLNAEIRYTVEVSGTHTILARSLGGGSSGAYTLDVIRN